MEVSLRVYLSLFLTLVSVLLVKTRSIPRKALENAETLKFDETNKDHWKHQAKWTLTEKLATTNNLKEAKNVILFLGDGMSLATIAATRVYLGQKYGFLGEEIKLSFEGFPYTGLVKTYCVDQNVADSACSGTAYLTGIKANSGTVGVSGAVKRGDCEAQLREKYTVSSLMHWAQRAGKATGVVTTTRVTHATPAASYANSADRRWEADSDMPAKYAYKCEDIATQLVRGSVGCNIDVVLGGGRKKFLPSYWVDEEGVQGTRKDGKHLIEEWLQRKNSMGAAAAYVTNRTQLLNLDTNKYDSVLGLFSAEHMPYNLERTSHDPTLREMTRVALEILSKNKDGFFLFVEGGKIDIAHHETKARKALDETAEFAKTVETATRFVDPENTLIVVTADHSHTMTYNGYSTRGSDILGLTNRANATDYLPYTTLSYANGPGPSAYQNSGYRRAIFLDELKDLNYTYPALFPMGKETHGGEDVAIYAVGPWSHLFTGNFEQNFIPHAIGYAACMGPGLTHCD